MDEQLKTYGQSDYYPFHMPGHKRQILEEINPYEIDITEIHGFDNLHHATGVIAELQQGWAELYGCDRAYILVNGTTCGNEAAIFAATRQRDTVLVARGCHRSVYHALTLRQATCAYLYPEISHEGICYPVTPEEVAKGIAEHPEASAIVITTPTYEGLCADVAEIADLAHKANMSLIVDAAHGAHFGLGGTFPENPIHQGADAVVVSLHKTLPTLTQTACLLWKETSRIDSARIQKYLGYFESSSPSYVLMNSTAVALRFLQAEGKQRMEEFTGRLEDLRASLKDLKQITIDIPAGWDKTRNADASKIIIRGKTSRISGEVLMTYLREAAHLELEMATPAFALAMTSLVDTKEGFDRLEKALRRLDEMDFAEAQWDLAKIQELYGTPRRVGKPLYEVVDAPTKQVPLAVDQISGGFVNLYPPGSPVYAPGEILEAAGLRELEEAQREGFEVDGITEENTIEILA